MKIVKWFDFEGSKIFEDIYKRLKGLSENSEIIFLDDDDKNIDINHFHRLDRFLIKKSEAMNVATIHFDLRDDSMFKDRELFLKNISRIDKFICLNNNQVRSLIDLGCDESNIFLIPHGYVEKSLLNAIQRKDYSFLKNKVKIGFFSKRYNNKLKGENFLYQIASNLNTERFEFILSGFGRQFEKKKLESLGFSVRLISDTSYDSLLSVYKLVDVVLVLSRSEGGPACLPDALVSGVTVLSTPVGMSEDIKRSNLLVLKTVDEFVSILNSNYLILLEQETSLKGLYSWSYIFKKHEEVYLE